MSALLDMDAETIRAEMEDLIEPSKLTKYRTSRIWRRCHTRSAWSCEHIDAGDRYARTAFPPGSEPFHAETWIVVVECAACADYCGRPIPAQQEAGL